MVFYARPKKVQEATRSLVAEGP